MFLIQDMMRYLNWTRAAILYEDEFGLVRLQDLVRTPPTNYGVCCDSRQGRRPPTERTLRALDRGFGTGLTFTIVSAQRKDEGWDFAAIPAPVCE